MRVLSNTPAGVLCRSIHLHFSLSTFVLPLSVFTTSPTNTQTSTQHRHRHFLHTHTHTHGLQPWGHCTLLYLSDHKTSGGRTSTTAVDWCNQHVFFSLLCFSYRRGVLSLHSATLFFIFLPQKFWNDTHETVEIQNARVGKKRNKRVFKGEQGCMCELRTYLSM